MIEFYRNIARFLVLILTQIVLLNQIEISVFFNPIIVVFLVLAFPFDMPKWFALLLSFIMGLIVDAFMNTPGITSFALVTTAYFRPFVLQIIQPRGSYQSSDRPNVDSLGWNWYIKYSVVLTVLFHLVYFIILGLGHDNALISLLKTIISAIFTIVLIFLLQLFTLRHAT